MRAEEIDEAMRALDPAWTATGGAIERDFRFKNFQQALAFVNRIGALAEDQGHHPDICLHGWNRVRLTMSTHAIRGLSRNDFIMASKVDGTFESG